MDNLPRLLQCTEPTRVEFAMLPHCVKYVSVAAKLVRETSKDNWICIPCSVSLCQFLEWHNDFCGGGCGRRVDSRDPATPLCGACPGRPWCICAWCDYCSPYCSRNLRQAANRQIYQAADGQFYRSDSSVRTVYNPPEQFDSILKAKVESAKTWKETKRAHEVLMSKLCEILDKADALARPTG